MASVFDVAEYVLEKVGYVSTMKLQKLVFYSNALSLVQDNKPLFSEPFQAWVNGPVCPSLFQAHKGDFIIGPHALKHPCSASRLGNSGRALIDKTIQVLGDYSGQELSDFTHAEKPWLDARSGCSESERSNAPITNTAVRSYYSSSDCTNPLFAHA